MKEFTRASVKIAMLHGFKSTPDTRQLLAVMGKVSRSERQGGFFGFQSRLQKWLHSVRRHITMHHGYKGRTWKKSLPQSLESPCAVDLSRKVR